MKNVTLVIPNSHLFDSAKWDIYPYNVCLLAAVLEPRYTVSIVDCNIDDLSLEESQQAVAATHPDCIGITCLAVEYNRHAHELARTFKTAMPTVPIVLGGVYCTLLPEHAMQNDAIDVCVLGEGELVFGPLLKVIAEGGTPRHLDGVAYRENGRVIIKPQVDFVHDLDNLPLPAYDKVDLKRYMYVDEKFSISDRRDAVPAIKIYASRGCPAGCNFCAVEHIAGKKFRVRSVESILDEIQFMIDTYGVKEVVFFDDNLIFDRNRAVKLFQGMIDRQFNIAFKPANIAVYRLDPELLDLMKKAGCTLLVFAVESAVNRVLHDIMGKPLRIEKVRGIIEHAKSIGFRCGALFVIGNPGETWDEIHETIAFAESLGIYCHFSIATPLPHTRLHKTAVKQKLLTEDFTFEQNAGCSRGWMVTDQFAPFDLEVLRVYEWDRINFSTPQRRERTAAFFKVSVDEAASFARDGRVAMQNRYVPEPAKRLTQEKK